MVQKLLEGGSSVDAVDKKDRRPLHWAAHMGHTEVVRLLLTFGAHVNSADKAVCMSFHRQQYLVLTLSICGQQGWGGQAYTKFANEGVSVTGA